MRKIILFIASSLDVYIARKNGNIDWLFTDADYGYAKFYRLIDAVLMGRKTYAQAKEVEEYPFKGKKAYVFTKDNNLKKDKNVEFVNDVVGFSKKLIKSSGKNIWLVGGGEIVSIFLNNNLLDEIVLSIHPILLGKGIPLFNNIQKETKFEMVRIKKFKSGLLQTHYNITR